MEAENHDHDAADTDMRAEVAHQIESKEPAEPDAEPVLDGLPEGTVAVPLGEDGPLVRVLPVEEWSSSAQEDLSYGRFDSWAEDALARDDSRDDYEEVWLEARDGRGPNVRMINEMFQSWRKATGQDTGKSRAVRRSSGRTRRR